MNRPQKSGKIALVATGCAAIVVLILGCSSDLSRPPDGSALVGGAGGGGNGGQNAGNDAASAACLGPGLSCTAGQACCSGICDVSTGTCGSSVALCLDPGLPCQYATDCCNLSCVGGFCAPAVSTCVADNAACTSSATCCSGNCSAGFCSPLNTACKTAGNPCADSTECCSHLCTNGTCTLSASYCIQTGDVCYRGSDCCSGLCNTSGAGTAGVCGELSTTGAGNCAKDGTVCEDCTNCCSALCLPFARTGVKICQPASGCRVTNNLCIKDKDCCGGDSTSGLPGAGNVTCQLADNVSPALGVCRNPLGCNPQGGICGLKNSTGPACTNAREDCCDCQPPKWQCCKPDSIGVPRCYGGSTTDCPTGYTGQEPCCIHGGDVCTFSAECCGGVPCVPGADGQLRCMNRPDGGDVVCVPSAGVCTSTSDCCAGLTCNITPGQPTGLCGSPPVIQPPTGDGGIAPAGDAATDVPSTPGICALPSQSCSDALSCCDNVPCNAPGYTGQACAAGQQGCSCYEPFYSF
jgi:hypothetical protein